jgi:hypothetical protein
MLIKGLKRNIFGRTTLTSIMLVILLVAIPVIYFIPDAPIRVKAQGGEDPNAYYGTLLETTLSDTLYCPRFEQSTDWDTKIKLFNPDETAATLDITFYETDGDLIYTEENVNIEPLNTLYFSPDDYDVTDESGSIIVESNIDITGSVLRIDDQSASSELLQWVSDTSEGDRNLFSPKFIQATGWETWICLHYHNDGSTSISVDLDFYDLGGNWLETKTETLSPKETIYKRPSDWTVDDDYGNIEISASNVPSGGVLIGYTLRTDGEMTYSEPLPSSITDSATSQFSQLSGDVNFDTNIIIQNPTSSSITIDLDLYDGDGDSLGLEYIQVDSHASSTIEISEYTSEYFGSIYLSSSGDGEDFTGYMALLGDNGAGLSTELATEYSTTLYAPDVRDAENEGIENEGFHGIVWISNFYEGDIEVDVLFTDSDGSTQELFDDLEIPENSAETPSPDPTDVPFHGASTIDVVFPSGPNIDIYGIDLNALGTSQCGNCQDDCCGADCSCDRGETRCYGSTVNCWDDGCEGTLCNAIVCGVPECSVSWNRHGSWECTGATSKCNCGGTECNTYCQSDYCADNVQQPCNGKQACSCGLYQCSDSPSCQHYCKGGSEPCADIAMGCDGSGSGACSFIGCDDTGCKKTCSYGRDSTNDCDDTSYECASDPFGLYWSDCTSACKINNIGGQGDWSRNICSECIDSDDCPGYSNGCAYNCPDPG